MAFVFVYIGIGEKIRQLVAGFPSASALEPRSGSVEFVVNKVALGQVFS
jgi:hypothetical protein